MLYVSTILFLALFLQILQFIWNSKGLISQCLEQVNDFDFCSQSISACASTPKSEVSNWVKQLDTSTDINMHIMGNKK